MRQHEGADATVGGEDNVARCGVPLEDGAHAGNDATLRVQGSLPAEHAGFWLGEKAVATASNCSGGR